MINLRPTPLISVISKKKQSKNHSFLYLYPFKTSDTDDVGRTKWLLYARNFILTAFAAAFILSCANIARPTGGPIDTTPPVFVKSNPKPNQLNFNKSKIEIEFDEIIQVDKPTEKVIVSPAQKNMPQIQTSGRKVIVELQDSLIPNTTYTIDFSDAISDNNERNPLYNFSFSFATGTR